MGRRGENIRKRPDGRWEARVVLGSPVEGRTRYKFLYGKTYQEARHRKQEFCQSLKAGEHAYTGSAEGPGQARPLFQEGKQARPLFREAAQGWLLLKKASVKDSTFACYTLLLRKHILPVLGSTPLQEITSGQLTGFLQEKKAGSPAKGEKPLKDKTVADLKSIIVQILTWACQQQLIDSVPVCPSVSVRQIPTSVLTREEQRRLEAQLLKEDVPFSLGVLISLYGGARIGEACALKWEDIDFQTGTVRINKTVRRIYDVASGALSGTRLTVSSPKTECSIRSIPLPEKILKYLQARRKSGGCYVMTGTCRPMEPRAALARLKRLLKRAGVAEHTWHALRHTFATRCVESGVDVKSLSEIMGHSDVKITMQRYVHPSMDVKKEQINKLPCGL